MLACRKHYDVDIENVDYQGDTEGARQLINQWVESQTNDKIKDLLPSGSVNDLTRMVLVNAIYFKVRHSLYKISRYLITKSNHSKQICSRKSKNVLECGHIKTADNFVLSDRISGVTTITW